MSSPLTPRINDIETRADNLEQHAAVYRLSANFVTNATTPINFDTQVLDTNSAVTTSPTAWKFTAPVDGIYLVTGIMEILGSVNVSVYKNGTIYNTMFWNSGSYIVNGSVMVQLNASDYIDLRGASSVTITGGAVGTHAAVVNIKRIGS